jgi:branched-chain amino acid transport system substrate-binding protein
MPLKRSCVAAALVALFLTSAPPAARSASAIEVPVIISLTGPGALIGAPMRKALEVLAKSINDGGGISGAQLHLTFQDDGSVPQNAVQFVDQAIAAKIPLFLGPSGTATCRATAPLVDKAGPVQYCLSPGGPTPKGGFEFSSGYATLDAYKTAVRYFHALGYKKIAILAPTDATGQDGEHTLDTVLADYKDITVVEREHFNVGDVSILAQIARIKASDPQMLFAWATGTPLGTILHGMVDGGLDVPTFTSHGNMTYSTMDQFGGLIPKGGLFFTGPLFVARDVMPKGPALDAVDRFSRLLEAAGAQPDVGYSLAWDAGIVSFEALKHVGPSPTAAQIRDYIETVHGLGGSAAVFDFRDGSQRGITAASILVARWRPQSHNWIAVSEPGGKPIPNR